MKNKIINKKGYRIVAALMMTLVFGAYFVVSNLTAYASDIIITGDAAGSLSVTSADKMLFDLTGLYPGDNSASSVTISNTDMVNDGFEVFMYATNTAGAEYDLGIVTKLTVTDGTTTVYDGMLINFDDRINSQTPISLGRLAKGTSKSLDFVIEIDGEKADNNYQEQQSHFVVTFVASSYGAPVVTQGPGPGPGPGDEEEMEPDPTPTPTVAPTTAPSETPAPTEDGGDKITLTDDDVPMGNIDLDDQDTPLGSIDSDSDETIELMEEDVPLGTAKEMPKTGESSLALNIIPGAVIICGGLFIIIGKGKRKVK